MKNYRHIFIPILFLILATLACGLPGGGTPTPDGNQLITEAVRTVEFQLTQGALNKSATATVPERPATVTLAATQAVTPGSTRVPSSPTTVACDQITFISDVTIPDGTKFNPGQTFTKKWLLKNTGSCAWTPSYSAVFSSGEKMGAPTEISLTGNVASGQTMELSINMAAPTTPGKYQGNWKFKNANGSVFGLPNGLAFYVTIEVVKSAVTQTSQPGSSLVYDFAANYCSATWSSEAGSLSCPGTITDTAGFVTKLDNPILATGSAAGGVALETHPLMEENAAWSGDGSIQGAYPAIAIKSGHHFKSQIACLSEATTCDVTFSLNYSADGGSLESLGSWAVAYDNSIRSLDIDLADLADQNVQFFMVVDAANNGGKDAAVWVNPRIVK